MFFKAPQKQKDAAKSSVLTGDVARKHGIRTTTGKERMKPIKEK